MSADKQPVEDKPVKSEQTLMQEFVDKYQKLCEEYKLQIVVMPVFISRDDGTFSVKLNSSIGKLPK